MTSQVDHVQHAYRTASMINCCVYILSMFGRLNLFNGSLCGAGAPAPVIDWRCPRRNGATDASTSWPQTRDTQPGQNNLGDGLGGLSRGCTSLQARRRPGIRTRAEQSRVLLRERSRGGLPKDE